LQKRRAPKIGLGIMDFYIFQQKTKNLRSERKYSVTKAKNAKSFRSMDGNGTPQVLVRG
jgi:hypothetical protein